MTRIAIIGTVGVPACYGGFESLVENLLDYTPADVQYTVFCSGRRYAKQLQSYKGADLVYLDAEANGTYCAFYDYKSMKMSLDADIMLILGVSGCVFLPVIRRRFKGKIITNIDGLEWKRKKWPWYAKLFLHFSEKQAVTYSDTVIGDNSIITDYVKRTYGRKAVLIAYGGDQAAKAADATDSTDAADDTLCAGNPFCFKKYAVTVCRIEPENNIHLILEAFAKTDELPLVIVGNWELSRYGRSLKAKYAGLPHIRLFDPVYEEMKINRIRSYASVYIHGHSAGGTNPSLVEAMNLGLPVLAYDCAYNRASTEEKCLYWKTSAELAECIRTNQSELPKIGAAMLEAGKRLYSWRNIAAQYAALYP